MSENYRPIKVFIIDSQPVFRDGIRNRIEQQPDFQVVGEADNSHSAYEGCKISDPEVILADPFTLGCKGIQNISTLKRYCPNSNILIAADANNLLDVQFVLSEGAAGYILKNSPSEEFINAMRVIASNGSYLPVTLMSGLIEAAKKTKSTGNMFGLTSRELDILREIAMGLSNKEIAFKLKISVRTVETHRQNIRQKTGTFATADLVRIANRLELVHQPETEESVSLIGQEMD